MRSSFLAKFSAHSDAGKRSLENSLVADSLVFWETPIPMYLLKVKDVENGMLREGKKLRRNVFENLSRSAYDKQTSLFRRVQF